MVNRLLTRFLGEVTAAVDEGTPFAVADHALEPLGLPMSPFVLLQLVGPAVALHVAETHARGVPGPVRRVGEPSAGSSRPASPRSRVGRRDAGGSTDEVAALFTSRRRAVDRRTGPRAGRSTRWRRRSG